MAFSASFTLLPMRQLAERMASLLNAGDIITLSGEVGSGKTTFARAMIEAIAVGTPHVTSPTFTLMQSYETLLAGGKRETLWHIDLYRLKHPAEAAELGLPELWPHITLIEWPEIIEHLLPSHLAIGFDLGKDQDKRTLTFSGDPTWQKRLKNIL